MNSMGEFLFERLSDPEYYEENRVAAHSDHVAYRNWNEADVWLDPLGRKSSLCHFILRVIRKCRSHIFFCKFIGFLC